MKYYYGLLPYFLFMLACTPSHNQALVNDPMPRLVGAPCEGCEAILSYDKNSLRSVDTLAGFQPTAKKLRISGRIYEADGRTPAAGVILYLYHTNSEGIYPKREEDTGWASRHGYIRGCLKTDAKGRYTFYTNQAGNYPGRKAAAHIHPTLLEPNGKYYYVEDYYFDGDPFLTEREKNPKAPRGGTVGVLQLTQEGDLWLGQRDFILGRNVPKYD